MLVGCWQCELPIRRAASDTKHRRQILDLAGKHNLPVASIYCDFVESGGLFAYEPSLDAVYSRAAAYVEMLFKGDAARVLPVEQPTKFVLVNNRKAPRAFGIAIPQVVLLRAVQGG